MRIVIILCSYHKPPELLHSKSVTQFLDDFWGSSGAHRPGRAMRAGGARGRGASLTAAAVGSMELKAEGLAEGAARPVKERKKHDRFNGMSEEEVARRTLPDHLAENLDIIIVSTVAAHYLRL